MGTFDRRIHQQEKTHETKFAVAVRSGRWAGLFFGLGGSTRDRADDDVPGSDDQSERTRPPVRSGRMCLVR